MLSLPSMPRPFTKLRSADMAAAAEAAVAALSKSGSVDVSEPAEKEAARDPPAGSGAAETKPKKAKKA